MKNTLLNDKDWLYTQYITNQMTTYAIAEEISSSNATVAKYLKQHNIAIRTSRVKDQTALVYLLDPEWMRNKYITEKNTIADIATILNCSCTSIRTHLKLHGVALRCLTEAKLKDSASMVFLQDVLWMSDNYVSKKLSVIDIANALKCESDCIRVYLKYHGIKIRQSCRISSHEIELRQFLESYNIVAEYSCRDIIAPLELDVYVPSHKIAIELNGVYWHSLNEHTKNKKLAHLNKTIRCMDNDISLLHFTCIEWKSKNDIVKSMILAKLGIFQNKIFARQCEIVWDVPKADQKIFFDYNHIQGYTNSDMCYGLRFNGQYVSMISYGRPRYDKSYDVEIIRIASTLNTIVIGGISKLFKHSTPYLENKSIITYADRRYSTGNIYSTLGFDFLKYSDIGFKWIKGDREYNRLGFQKYKLPDKLEVFDSTLTAEQNMYNNKYKKMYDCGQSVYSLLPEIHK